MSSPVLAGVLMTLGLNVLLPATLILTVCWLIERTLVRWGWVEASLVQRATLAGLVLMPLALIGMNGLGPGALYVSMPEPVGSADHTLGFVGWSYLVLSLVWLFGSLALWFRLLRGLWWTHRMLRHSTPADPAWHAIVNDLATRHGFKYSEVRVSSWISVPCVSGLRRPVLIIPSSVDPTWDYEGVLIHELSHLRRRDPAWALLSRALCATLWVHPLAWRLHTWAGLTAEHACDDEAIRRTGDPVAYSRALLRFAERGWSSPRYAGVMSVGLTSSSHTLRGRVQRLLKPGADQASVRRTAARRAGMVLTILLLTLTVLSSTLVAIHHTDAAALAGFAWLWCAA